MPVFFPLSRKDGKKIVASDRIKVVDDQAATGFFELVIQNVTDADAGEYSCNALNRFGEAKSTAKITVTSKLTDSNRNNICFK